MAIIRLAIKPMCSNMPTTVENDTMRHLSDMHNYYDGHVLNIVGNRQICSRSNLLVLRPHCTSLFIINAVSMNKCH